MKNEREGGTKEEREKGRESVREYFGGGGDIQYIKYVRKSERLLYQRSQIQITNILYYYTSKVR